MLKNNPVNSENSFDPEYAPSITKALKMIKKLDDLGMLDYMSEVLDTEDTMESISTLIKSDEAVALRAKADQLRPLVGIIADKDTMSAIANLATILSALQKVGLLDPVIGMLKDDEVINAVMGLISNDFTMNLIANAKPILNSLSKLDLSAIPKYLDVLSSALTYMENGTIPPVKGLTGMLHELGDKDTQKGLGIVFYLLKSLGSANSTTQKADDKS
ncbi:DUF1641 superfamily protein [Candidatus Mancarchaeum acidiphilum]|uniref:DUF1641 superfamily protein n=1 Tax=Candidatus Mancarchaeum acidiphilum TaxID=1920749 RepID=A0A218NLX3_9ARCH|nr:DUF1641 domain-containing protein [Candidatus Mancarchaeum acidiphilum]ASI13452.1 DUF1641 superfamily protein [Candidatus Mancarchaeum acidiphilum]